MRVKPTYGCWMCLAVVVAGLTGKGNAGWLIPNRPYEIQPQEKTRDLEPPATPRATCVRIERGQGPRRTEKYIETSSTDSFATILLGIVHLGDSRTPSDSLGVRMWIVAGTLPEGMEFPESPVWPCPTENPDSATVRLDWIDGATDRQEAFDFLVAVAAMDRAGNESVPDTVRIVHGGSE